MIYIYFASFFTLDPWGVNYIQVPKTSKMYLDESQAQEACDKGCKPVKVPLPEGYDIAPTWVIERGYDDCAGDDGHDPDPRDRDHDDMMQNIVDIAFYDDMEMMGDRGWKDYFKEKSC